MTAGAIHFDEQLFALLSRVGVATVGIADRIVWRMFGGSGHVAQRDCSNRIVRGTRGWRRVYCPAGVRALTGAQQAETSQAMRDCGNNALQGLPPTVIPDCTA